MKKLESSWGAFQERNSKFRFAIHPQGNEGIWLFHHNCQIARCRTVAILVPVYYTITLINYVFCYEDVANVVSSPVLIIGFV